MRRSIKHLLVSAVLLAAVGQVRAGPVQGTMYYTTFAGGVNVHKVDYNYNGSTFVLSNNTGIASTPGADGIVFTSDNFLAVGGQGSHVNRVNPSGGAFTTQSTNGPDAYHMSVAPDGSILAASIPGAPVRFNSTLTNTGTPLTFGTGPDSVLDTIVFDKTGQGWYTSGVSSGNGFFGKVNIVGNTYSTIRTISTAVPAAHGAAYDSTSDTIVLFGSNHISQVNPNTGGTSLLHDTVIGNGTFDQGAVDGQGHVFAANNDGNLTFMDISGSLNVAAPNFLNTQALAANLDDIAPLSGLGSTVPLPSAAMGGLVLMGLTAVSRIRRKK